MKKAFFYLLVLASLLPLISIAQPTKSPYWDKVQQPNLWKENEFNVSGLAKNEKGIILAYGFTSDYLKIDDYQLELKFKIYRTKDNGKHWEEIKFLEAKMFNYYYNPIMGTFAPSVRANCIISSVGDKFYLNFEEGYFESNDDGTTWNKTLEAKIDRTQLVFLNSKIRFAYFKSWTHGPDWPNYALYKKNGSSWEYSVGSQIKEYQLRPPIKIWKGMDLTFCDMVKGDKFGGLDYPFYQRSRDNTEMLIPCDASIIKNYPTNIGGWGCFLLPDVYVSRTSSNYMYTRFTYTGGSKLYLSTNNGKTFSPVTTPNIEEVLGILPICDDGSIIIYASPKNESKMFPIVKFYISKDHANTWMEIGDYPNTQRDQLRDFIILNNGQYLYGTCYGMYISTNKIGCSNAPPQEESTFGTTIITHGFQLTGEAPINNKGEWGIDMAQEILKKANGKGCIKKYNKKSGHFDVIQQSCSKEGETILLFDWAEESNNNTHGYSEGAGDALFAALLNAKQLGEISLENLHFIGHSRGTVVNSECVLRLLAIGVEVDHVTYLDPHDWGVNTGTIRVVDDFDVHPDFPPINGINGSHQAVNGWQGINFCDTYFQDAGIEVGNCGDCGDCARNGGLEGRSVSGSLSELWNYYGQCKLCHSNLHSCGYTKSIIAPLGILDKKGGYKYARLGGEMRSNSNQPNVNLDFDFFKTYEYKLSGNITVSRTKGVFNGSFDRHGLGFDIPGWEFHGGGMSSLFEGFVDAKTGMYSKPTDEFDFSNDYAKLTNYFASKHPISLTHNRFYIPLEAQSLTFKLKTENIKSAKVNIYVETQDGTTGINQNVNNPTQVFNLDKNVEVFTENIIDIRQFKGKVVTIRFEFKGIKSASLAPNAKDKCSFYVDDVKLSTKPTSSSSSTLQSPTSNKSHIETQLENQIDKENQGGNSLENGRFDSDLGWKATSGSAIIKDGVAKLETNKNKVPMILESNEFRILESESSLILLLDKTKVINGELKIYLVKDGIDEVIYTTKINNSFAKTLEVVEGVAKTAETGNIPEEKPVALKFEPIEIDITKFRGKNAKLKLGFETRGLLKSELFIDEIRIE